MNTIPQEQIDRMTDEQLAQAKDYLRSQGAPAFYVDTLARSEDKAEAKAKPAKAKAATKSEPSKADVVEAKAQQRRAMLAGQLAKRLPTKTAVIARLDEVRGDFMEFLAALQLQARQSSSGSCMLQDNGKCEIGGLQCSYNIMLTVNHSADLPE